jgi:hypothetical protein
MSEAEFKSTTVTKGARLIQMYEIERDSTRAANEIFLIKLMGGDPMKIEYYRKYLIREFPQTDEPQKPLEDDDFDDIEKMKNYLKK